MAQDVHVLINSAAAVVAVAATAATLHSGICEHCDVLSRASSNDCGKIGFHKRSAAAVSTVQLHSQREQQQQQHWQ
eukprot:15782-Heterococcus_DN1.PRE.4